MGAGGAGGTGFVEVRPARIRDDQQAPAVIRNLRRVAQAAVLAERHAEHEHVRSRLDGEKRSRIVTVVDAIIGAAAANEAVDSSQRLAIGPRQQLPRAGDEVDHANALAVVGNEQVPSVGAERGALPALAHASLDHRDEASAVSRERIDGTVLAVADEDARWRDGDIAGMKAPRAGRDAASDTSVRVDGDQRSALARMDTADAGGTIRRDPQALPLAVPAYGERVETCRQGGQRATREAAREDLPVEDAGKPNGLSVARNAFDDAVLRIDVENRLRLRRDGGSEAQQSYQRSAPATSFCSFEWIDPDAATYSPRSNARSAPR